MLAIAPALAGAQLTGGVFTPGCGVTDIHALLGAFSERARAMTPDHRFIIGPDPRLTGFYWVAGPGGHGMTTSAGVGEIAARGLVDNIVPAPFGEAFAPGRFPRQ